MINRRHLLQLSAGMLAYPSLTTHAEQAMASLYDQPCNCRCRLLSGMCCQRGISQHAGAKLQ